MKYISVDFELDGPSIPHYSVVCFGAVVIDNKLNKTFYGKMAPISEKWIPEALAISGFTREQHLTFKKPQEVMSEFLNWVKEYGGEKVSFVSDCLTGDWLAANYYFHEFTGENLEKNLEMLGNELTKDSLKKRANQAYDFAVNETSEESIAKRKEQARTMYHKAADNAEELKKEFTKESLIAKEKRARK